ncbi:cation efflux system protein CzcB [Sulfuriferula nivalis]|uniref:Cation efflux system protein CzcB n=2 Tax=Sulfuriferula nivalis TaxID=2675298 RepID=A0A809RJG0_9PROT|nr:cation efflux system protein CzcB [Sulfuriferula nivalis]
MKKTALIIALIAVGLVGAYYEFGGGAAKPVAKPVTVSTTPADELRYPAGAPQLAAIHSETLPQLPVPLADPLNAKVTYDEDVTTRINSPISGRVLNIKAQLGDEVKAGQTLFVMDSPDLGNAIADVEKANADARLKQLNLSRAKTLYQGEAIARKDLESAQSDYAAATAESRRAILRLKNLAPQGINNAAEGYALRSPISGVVAQRQLNPGEEVRPDLPDPLFIITNPAKVWVTIDLPESLLAKAEVGHPVSISVDAYPDQHFAGRIEKIAPALDPVTRRITVRCSVDNSKNLLKPEMYAKVTLLAEADENAFRIPNGAIVSNGLYSYVFVEIAPGVLKKRRIPLVVQYRDYSYAAEGLTAQDKVVTSGALLLNSELDTAK